MKLSDVVSLDKKFARSINLERDRSKIDIVNNYRVTAKALEVIERFVAAMGEEKVSAWSLVGPYGMGKSVFLNFLLSLTGPYFSPLTQRALKKLAAENKELHHNFIKNKMRLAGDAGFFQIPVVSAFEPITATLARGLQNAVLTSNLANKKKILASIDKIKQNGSTEAATLSALFKEVIDSASTPVVLIIDELGKNLEYLSYHSYNGDLFILQQLAEMDKVYLFVCLHQAFDEYLSSFSSVQQQEWNKIKGRFEEISYVESTAQMLYLIRSIFSLKKSEGLSLQVQEWAAEIKSNLAFLDIAGKEYFDVKTIAGICPLHPLTSLALIELCRRYAQNERTLISFVSSGHTYALPAQLNKITLDPDKRLPAVGLDCLYDYFFQLNHTSLKGRSNPQHWVEIHDNIQSANQLSDEEVILLKNIGVLNLLRGSLGLKASYQVINSLMEYSTNCSPEKVQEMLDSLTRRGIIFFRKYAGEFRIWEGSDFDVNGSIEKEKSKLSILSLEEILEKNLPLSPVIAARYALKTGIMRKFERRWIAAESLTNKLVPQQGFDGLLLYCYGTMKEPLKVPEVCYDRRPLIVAYAPVKETLSEIVLELMACRRVLEIHHHLLNHDKVARKEVNYRLQVAQEKFRDYLARAFAPGAKGLLWYIKGEKYPIPNRRRLSEKLSELCQECYKYAPTIPNEIISGEKLSSAAVRARRELVQAMASRADQENLGFTGWGPEVAIYKALLLAKGLHRKNPKTGSWYLTLESNERELSKVWEALDEMVKGADDKEITVKDMVDKLRECPFGLRQGPALIYLSLYLLVKAENLTIFREGIYQPYLKAADMALLLKRPELFTVKRFIANEVEEKVFAAYKDVLQKSQLKKDPNLRNATMLGVVGPLMKFIDQLPRYTKQTGNVSRKAQRARAVIINTTDPLKFLFEELPEALEIDVKNASVEAWTDRLRNNLKLVLDELEQAYEDLNKKVQKAVLEIFSCLDIEQLYASQRKLARDLIAVCGSNDLKPILHAMAREESDQENWVRGIAGAIIKKPLDVWKDDDFARFKAALADYADRIEQLKAFTIADSSRNLYVISVIDSKGEVKRDVVNIDNDDLQVNEMVDQILKLPADKSRKVLALLANKLISGG